MVSSGVSPVTPPALSAAAFTMAVPSASCSELNWNGIRHKHLSNFLPSVLKHSKDAEVIVADNHSDDESLLWLKENHPDVRVIESPSNSGFASGYNKALKQVDAEYYVLLNSDIEVSPRWVE